MDPGTTAQPLQLEAGQVAELQVAGDGSVSGQLATPSGRERFVLILASTRFDAHSTPLPYTLALRGTQPAGTQPASTPESSSANPLLTGCSLSSERFTSSALASDPPPVASGTVPVEGATRTLNVPTRAEPQSITARAVSVGEHAVIWADTTHPTTLDRAFVLQFRDDFERVILPRARQVFGTEPDLDGDGRIQLVFTRLTRERGVAFFSACDLAERLEGCQGSNRGEFLYLTPPDAIEPPYNSANAIKEILAHEVAHLLHFQRKVLRNRLPGWNDGVYMSEGIGALAQDVTGYQAGNLYVTRAALAGIDQFSLADVLHGGKPDPAREGVLRGGAYLFVRYLYDRAGGDAANGIALENRGGPSSLRALIDAPVSIDEALPSVTASDTASVALDFYTALALSNREPEPANPCFRYLPTSTDPVTQKQRGANLYARFHGTQLQGPQLAEATSPDGQLRTGGVDYLQLAATAPHSTIRLDLHFDPQSAARVRIARIE
ncbi:MAG: hypothetical protein RL685_1407 [Pseudomonadota bacterium]|jgi:hypothetical protein